MNPKDVIPKRWSELKVISDDGAFSYAYGYYYHNNGNVALELGGRWNGDSNNPSDVGYPNLAGNPIWFVIDPSMVRAILSELENRAFALGDDEKIARIIRARKAFKI